ncbi:MAG: serine hydrolase domain-containing protein, partial [Actinomycetes bacterium]
RDGAPHLLYEFVDGMKDLSDPLEAELVPVTDTVFAARGSGPFAEDWMPVVFATLSDGTRCAYIGMRAAPKVG